MGFLNKIKLIFTNKQEKNDETKETIQIEELPTKLENKIHELTKLKKQLKEDILKRISSFESEINERIISLENIDISKRKEYDKIKLIVTENLSLYTVQLKRLVNNLKNIKDLETKESVSKLFFILNDFNKVSQVPFEKVTILIGKEMQAVRETINNFIKDIDKIANYKELFEKTEISNKLSFLLSELKKNKLYEEELKKKREELYEELKRKDEECCMVKQRTDSVKNSLDYKEDMQKKEEHEEKLKKLEDELQLLKQKINFKLLAKYFHHDNKKIQIIKDYANNFKSCIKNDNDLRIVDFVKEAQGIEFGSLEELRKKIIDYSDQLITPTDKDITVFEENLKELDFSIIGVKVNIDNESKKMERVIAKREKIISEVKNLSNSMFSNIEIW